MTAPAGQNRSPRRLALLAAGLGLLASTVFWSLLAAWTNQSNADELINPRLFADGATFAGASFPGAHSFLLKWPLFWLVQQLGASPQVFALATVGLSLLTVGGLAYILSRIERRPLVLAALWLALAAALVAVPAQAAPGVLLPVNLAMLASRNLEYVVFVGCLAGLVRHPSFRRVAPWLAGLGLTLLFASDKLFIGLSLGAAILLLLAAGLRRQRQLVGLALRLAGVSLVALVVASLLLAAINQAGLTHITSQSSATPYGLVASPKQVVIGVVYAGLDGLTNFGANPVYDVPVIRDVLPRLGSRLASLGLVSSLLNLVVLAAGLVVAGRLVAASWRVQPKTKKSKPAPLNQATQLSLLLLAASLAAAAAFVFTNHYQPVDARYLGILPFALFIAAATSLRGLQLRPKLLGRLSLVLLISLFIGAGVAWQGFEHDQAALRETNRRTQAIASLLHVHPVDRLLGSYWRVLPATQANPQPKPLPLRDCFTPATSQTSTAWRANLHKQSFAYLLSLDAPLVPFAPCSLGQVEARYGRPNSSVVIAGSYDQPRELLLFYDHGIRKKRPAAPVANTLPLPLSQVSGLNCLGRPTLMNIVAHQDDDLLFLSPDLLTALNADACVRSVYLTAGDAGSSQFYWLSREQGSEAAYASMLDIDNNWVQKTVKLGEHQFVTLAKPVGNLQVLLIFFHLPDGNLNGVGFASDQYQSLARLEAQKVSLIHSVDQQSYYSSVDLTNALTQLMDQIQPTEIHTQATTSPSQKYADHSDHLATGHYVRAAYQAWVGQTGVPLQYYFGYPIREQPANVTDPLLAQKEAAFIAYSAHTHDTGCDTTAQCLSLPTYGAYLRRQYLSP